MLRLFISFLLYSSLLFSLESYSQEKGDSYNQAKHTLFEINQTDHVKQLKSTEILISHRGTEDIIAPIVTSIDANPSIGGINQCSQNNAAIDQLLVSFHDDNIGLIGTDVINNFVLIDTGNDQDLQSTNCLEVSGDDAIVTISGLIPGGTATDPTALLELGSSLTNGHYVLMVCDAITDASGNLLDGDNDGEQGGNFSRIFRVEQDNLFENAYFDDCSDVPVSLSPWQGSSAVAIPFVDFDDSSLSGSVLLNSNGGNIASIGQCVNLLGESYFSFNSRFLESANLLQNDADIIMSCEFSDLANCASIIDVQSDSQQIVSSKTPIWQTFSTTMFSPPAAVSANCKVSLFSSSDGGFLASTDEIIIKEIPEGPVMILTKSDGDVSTSPGGNVTYTLDYSTTVGSPTTVGLVISEQVPLETTFLSASSTPGWICSPDNNAGSICELTPAELLPGGNDSATFTVQVNNYISPLATLLNNTAIISATNAINSATNSDETPITSAVAALDVTITDNGVSDTIPGNSIIYQIVASNAGNRIAAGTFLTDVVPPNTIFNANLSTDWNCFPDGEPGSSCTIEIGELAGDSFITNFVVDVIDSVSSEAIQIENTVILTAEGIAPTQASDTTPINAEVSLRMVKSDGGVEAGLDSVVSYTLNYFNDGNRNAIGGVLTETVPDNTTFYPQSSSPEWACTPDNTAGSNCTINIGDITGGQKNSSLFSVKVNSTVPGGTTSISNTASIDATNAPLLASDSEETPLDGLAPVITLIDAIPTISEISQCSQNDAMINQLIVAFDENNDGLIGVDNSDNYRLIDTGMDQDLQTMDCGALLGDDVIMPFSDFIIGGTTNNPTASLDIGMTLKDGVYALLVCDDITDSIGNQLDGDGDGIQGGNLVQNFRIEQGNLFDNAFLDNCPDAPIFLPPWMTIGGDVVVNTDSNDSLLSGSIELISVDGSAVSASQCIDVTANNFYSLETSVLGTFIQNGDLDIELSCDFSSVIGCGSIIDSHTDNFTYADSVTPIWQRISSVMVTPMNAVSANCKVSLSSPSNNEFVNYLDEFDYRDADLIFENGFELMVD